MITHTNSELSYLTTPDFDFYISSIIAYEPTSLEMQLADAYLTQRYGKELFKKPSTVTVMC